MLHKFFQNLYFAMNYSIKHISCQFYNMSVCHNRCILLESSYGASIFSCVFHKGCQELLYSKYGMSLAKFIRF